MENLNAEMIKKGLECCSKDDCDNCPNSFGNCYANLAEHALALINSQEQRIKELTEENEGLYRTLDDKIQECEKWKWRLPIECDYTEKITIKKMELMLAVHFGTYTEDDTVKIKDVFKLIDQIAKEMSEGENEN